MQGNRTDWNQWHEKANLLAKKTAAISFVGPKPFCGIRIDTYRRKPKDREEKLTATI